MKSLIFCFFSLLLGPSYSNAQSIYLEFDEACMDRLEYNPTDGTTPYISYSIQMAQGKMAVLDIGTESRQGIRELKGKIYRCSDLAVDKALVQRINEGSTKLVIVTESSSQYFLSTIDKAAFIEQFRNTIEFLSADAEFVLYTDNLVSDVNLAKPTSKLGVYLVGTLRNECTTGFILAKKENQRSTSYKEFTLLPEVGIIEKRSVSGTGFFSDNSSNVLKLNRIGKLSFREYLALLCDRKQADYYDGNAGLGTSTYSDLVEKRPADVPTDYGDNPCAVSKTEGTHIVQKGETMYGIARRYGISLEELRSWNNLQGTDILSICQQIYVRRPASLSPSTGPAPTATTEKGTGTSTTDRNYWLSGPQVHVVKPGETVAMLANMYGYTEERFRKMNSLSAVERVYIGQKLHTNDCVCPTLESTTIGQPVPYENVAPSLANPSDVYFRAIKVHVVQKDETIFSIANQYQTTPERIMELNGLKKGEAIKIDQRLYVQ